MPMETEARGGRTVDVLVPSGLCRGKGSRHRSMPVSLAIGTIRRQVKRTQTCYTAYANYSTCLWENCLENIRVSWRKIERCKPHRLSTRQIFSKFLNGIECVFIGKIFTNIFFSLVIIIIFQFRMIKLSRIFRLKIKENILKNSFNDVINELHVEGPYFTSQGLHLKTRSKTTIDYDCRQMDLVNHACPRFASLSRV